MPHNDGGQRRTVELKCGKIFRGSVREVNGKVNIHRRHCEICKEAIEHNSVATRPFNSVQGSSNGWNGICGNGRRIGVASGSVNRHIENTVSFGGNDLQIVSSRDLNTDDIVTALNVMDDLNLLRATNDDSENN